MLMFAHNFPQAAPDTIANNRAAEAPTHNETSARQAGILHFQSREHHKLAPFRMGGLFYTIKI